MAVTQTEQKRRAGEYAVRFVRSGTIVGLGHGSTAIFAIRRIAVMLGSGELADIVAVPCSLAVEAEARALGIPLTTLEVHPKIDVTIDGADEVDPALNVIKGGGGAMLREKIVAQASGREVIVVDEGKLSDRLGTHWPVPVEVVSFGLRTQVEYLTGLGATVKIRETPEGAALRTDAGNLVLDCDFGPITDLPALARALEARAGIVAHGLFLGLVTDVVVARADGSVQVLGATQAAAMV